MIDPKQDIDPDDGRDESLNERLDRNWGEILQELRVTQTGTQILTGFLLAIAFQTKFDSLTVFQTRIYLVLVIAAVATTALGLAPVNLHRGLFRKHKRLVIVRTAHIILRIMLFGVAVTLTGTVLLIFDVVVSRSAAYLAAAGTLVMLLLIATLPLVLRILGTKDTIVMARQQAK
jgi:hypothetical protein